MHYNLQFLQKKIKPHIAWWLLVRHINILLSWSEGKRWERDYVYVSVMIQILQQVPFKAETFAGTAE